MQGFGEESHLTDLIDGNEGSRSLCAAFPPKCPHEGDNAAYFAHLRTSEGEWNTRDDVYIKYDSHSGEFDGQLDRSVQGQLTAIGFGFQTFLMGPETGFGWKLAELLTSRDPSEKIFIIKIARGGMDLAADYRPPTSGYTGVPFNPPANGQGYGWAYREMVSQVSNTLDNIASIYPDYELSFESGYELAGLVYFQGFNDVIDGNKVSEYGTNLANFVKDVRADWNAPDLPIVIGQLGMHGDLTGSSSTDLVQRVTALRTAQSSVAETSSNVRLAETKDFVFNIDTSMQGFHYYRNADTFYYIGEEMAAQMFELL